MHDQPRIRAIRARAVLAPFRHPPAAATGTLPSAPLVLIDLETDAGITGRAYVLTYTPHAQKPVVDLLHSLGGLIEGDALAPLDLEAKLTRRLTLLGTPGLVGLAVAGIDMCAWDALAQARGVPLAVLLGGTVRPVRTYNSCGLWLKPVDQLPDEAEALLAEGGFGAVKLRLGREDPADDLAAVRAVRRRIGDTVHLMSDYNQRNSWNEAIARGRMLDDEGLYWIEEPVRHDDYEGSARVASALRTPIQTGENLLGSFEMLQALQARAMDFVMPDVQRIGGVTGWLRAASLAHAFGMEMSSHLFPEFSVHLLAATPTCHWLEYVDWASPVLASPVEVRNGFVDVPDRPGAGIEWNEAAIRRHLVP
ncbi:MAG: mandelate racemase [Betaproteobacteria bacterium]|nr:mandelate racemase [Betaproteobacteria bacterium]